MYFTVSWRDSLSNFLGEQVEGMMWRGKVAVMIVVRLARLVLSAGMCGFGWDLVCLGRLLQFIFS